MNSSGKTQWGATILNRADCKFSRKRLMSEKKSKLMKAKRTKTIIKALRRMIKDTTVMKSKKSKDTRGQ